MIFIDTSILVAFFAFKDEKHELANKLLTANSYEAKVTSREVINETLNWLAKNTHPLQVITAGKALIEDELVYILDFHLNDWKLGLEIINKFKDQKLSFTDATSFASIARHQVTKVISFDKDFNLLKGVKNLAYCDS